MLRCSGWPTAWYADPVSQMGNHRGREVGFIFGSRVLLVKGKLDGEAEFAGVGFTRQQLAE